MTQVNRTRWPVQSTKKGSEPNQNTNIRGPSRNVSTNIVTSINLNPPHNLGTQEGQEVWQDLL